MSEPKIAGRGPVKVELKEGETYAFCTCGYSENQPFCDGSHKSADGQFAPKVFKAEKDGPAFLCMCKHTNNAPFCDGTHGSLD